jgi:hypothetical protein
MSPVFLVIIVPILFVLGLLIWGIQNPLAWLVVSVLAIAIGLACAVYGLTELLFLRAQNPYQIEEEAGVMGGGIGGLVGGIVLLALALLRLRKKISPPKTPDGGA